MSLCTFVLNRRINPYSTGIVKCISARFVVSLRFSVSNSRASYFYHIVVSNRCVVSISCNYADLEFIFPRSKSTKFPVKIVKFLDQICSRIRYNVNVHIRSFTIRSFTHSIISLPFSHFLSLSLFLLVYFSFNSFSFFIYIVPFIRELN